MPAPEFVKVAVAPVNNADRVKPPPLVIVATVPPELSNKAIAPAPD